MRTNAHPTSSKRIAGRRPHAAHWSAARLLTSSTPQHARYAYALCAARPPCLAHIRVEATWPQLTTASPRYGGRPCTVPQHTTSPGLRSGTGTHCWRSLLLPHAHTAPDAAAQAARLRSPPTAVAHACCGTVRGQGARYRLEEALRRVAPPRRSAAFRVLASACKVCQASIRTAHARLDAGSCDQVAILTIRGVGHVCPDAQRSFIAIARAVALPGQAAACHHWCAACSRPTRAAGPAPCSSVASGGRT